jgi:hypothetical protein
VEEELCAEKDEFNCDIAKLRFAMLSWAEGEAESWARAVLVVLDERGITATSDQESLIEQCTDLDQVDKWLRRAVTAESADQVFAGLPQASR